jgi:hypothetical protein
VVAALQDAAIDARDVDGMAAASFSLAPDAAVDLAWKLGLSLRWLVQDTNGGSSAMNMLGHALRAIESGPPRWSSWSAAMPPGSAATPGRGEFQHRDAVVPGAARSRRAERRLCAGDQPADEEVRPAEIRLRPPRDRPARLGGA